METNDSVFSAPRLPLIMGVEYRRSYARHSDRGKLRNISLTGAFLEADVLEMETDDKLMVTFSISGRTRNITATVVWKNENGCGLRFHLTNNQDLQIIDDLMYFVESKRDSGKDVLDNIFRQVS